MIKNGKDTRGTILSYLNNVKWGKAFSLFSQDLSQSDDAEKEFADFAFKEGFFSTAKIYYERALEHSLENPYLHKALFHTVSKLGNQARATYHAEQSLHFVRDDLERAIQGRDSDFQQFGEDVLKDEEFLTATGKREAENIFRCISNVNALRKIYYIGLNWDDIRTILVDFSEIEDLAIASQRILTVASNTKQTGYITPESIRFLKRCITTRPHLSPYDIRDALEFFTESKDAFGGGNEKTAVENLVTFFTSVKRYDDEKAMVARYCTGERVRHVVDVFNSDKFIYVLGDRGGDLASELKSVSESDSERKRAIHIQMVSRILEQNALKSFLGIAEYTNLVRKILGRKNRNQKSFFQSLCPAYITSEQLQAVETFISGFDIERIPIHEYRNPTTARNKNFEARIQLGNAGELRALIKFYTSDEGENNAKREKFFLEGTGKKILEKYDVRVPPALASTKTRLKNGSECDVLLLYFINARTLDEIVNDIASPEYTIKGELITNATRELAKVHNATPDLEKKAAGITLFEVKSEYFSDDLKKQLEIPHSNIKREVAVQLLQVSKKLCAYLKSKSEKDGVYYKDSNTRNIFGPPQQEGDADAKSTTVTLLDYECGVKILGEVDLMKIMRNGCNFNEWGSDKDYKRSKWNTEKRQKIERYVATKRYFARENEQEVITIYNKARVDKQGKAKSYGPEAQKRFDMAALYTHIWYVAWFSHKMREDDISDQTRQIVGNRVNFHLVEAKLMLDHIMHDDGVSYITNNNKRQQLIKSLDLRGLRKQLMRHLKN